ncbi:transposase [Cloacibacterium caeni]|uniref:transposase n=1 Tax=Cloacibacterium caeni TaxID=2004710 RepID=UPI001BD0C075|nr:transposase [Cloacibacterium caeni]
MEIDEIEEGYFYHIYNRGNNSEKIFFSEENYAYFLKLLTKYIFPVADIYAYCLLNNHFHILVRIKEKNEIEINKLKFSTVEKPKEVSASRQFSHFLNAYSQAVNKKYARTGSLFEKRFERKRISDDHYLRQVILYINTNPLKHNLVEKPEDYKWSSYNSHISNAKTKLKRKEVIELFDDVENFVLCHKNYDFLNSIF